MLKNKERKGHEKWPKCWDIYRVFGCFIYFMDLVHKMGENNQWLTAILTHGVSHC